MKLTSESKCPLCCSGMTSFGASYSDGEEWCEWGLHRQQCTNRDCELPVKLWEEIARLKAESLPEGWRKIRTKYAHEDGEFAIDELDNGSIRLIRYTGTHRSEFQDMGDYPTIHAAIAAAEAARGKE